MEKELLISILKDSANQNSNIDDWMFFDSMWHKDKKINAYIEKNNISEANLVCVVAGSTPILFYCDFFIFGKIEMDYDDVLLCSEPWNYKKGTIDKRYIYIVKKGGDSKKLETKNDNAGYLEAFLHCIVTNRIERDYKNALDYYDTLYSELISDSDFTGKSLCVYLAKDLSEKFKTIFVSFKIVYLMYLMQNINKIFSLSVNIDPNFDARLANRQKLKLGFIIQFSEWIEEYLQLEEDIYSYFLIHVIICNFWNYYFDKLEGYNKDKHHKERRFVTDIAIKKSQEAYTRLYEKLNGGEEMLELPVFVKKDPAISKLYKSYEVYDKPYMCIEMCYYFANNSYLKNANSLLKWYLLTQNDDKRFNNLHYGEVAYHISCLYRDGLGGEEKSETLQEKYLKESASVEYSLAYGDLSILYHNRGDEQEARRFSDLAIKKGVNKKDVYNHKLVDTLENLDMVADTTGKYASQFTDIIGGISHVGINFLGGIIDIFSKKNELDEMKSQTNANINQIRREDELKTLKHEQDIAGQKAVNKRIAKKGYKNGKKK